MAEQKKPLRALLVIRYFHPFIGGLEKKVFNLALALSRAGYRITVVTSRFYRSWPKREHIEGIEILRIPSPRIKIAGALVYVSCLFAYILSNRGRFELFHAFQVGYSSACAIIAGRLLGISTALTLSSSGSGGDVQRHRRTPWGRLFLRCCLTASRIIALQPRMREEVLALRPAGDVAIVPNGVDTGLYRPSTDRGYIRRQLGILPECRLILYAGRLSAEKGVDHLLNGFKLLQPRERLLLWIYGEGPERPRLERRIRELGLEASVRLRGAAGSMAPLYQSADLFIMPSRFEGMSNAVLEAMACGVPVIATDVTGNRDLIANGETGLLVPYGDAAALSAAAAAVLGDPALAARLGENARAEAAAKYSLAGAAALHGRLYAELARGGLPA